MNNADLVRAIVVGGTTISKVRLLDAVRLAPERDFYFTQDPTSKFAIVRIKLGK